MTTRRLSRGRSVSRGQRRKLVWYSVEDAVVIDASVSTEQSIDMMVDLRAQLGANALPGHTVMRVRGQIRAFFVGADPGPIVNDAVDVRMAIVTGARSDTTGSLPMPFQDEGDWMWMGYIAGVQRTVTDGVFHKAVMVDTKAKRKIEEIDSTLFFVAKSGITGGPDLQLGILLQVLVALP